jgi:hypothetical protein
MNFRTFSAHDNESGKLVHLPHLEDLPLTMDPEVAVDTVRGVLEDLIGILMGLQYDGTPNLFIKMDGAPSFLYGGFYQGERWISTKSGFASVKRAYNLIHIDEIFGERPELAEILKSIFTALEPIPWPSSLVVQADFLWNASTLRTKDQDGVEYWSFQPNVLEYVVPVSSLAGKFIRSSRLGIALHTVYHSSAWQATNVTDADRLRFLNHDVWLPKQEISDVSSLGINTADYDTWAIEREHLLFLGRDLKTHAAVLRQAAFRREYLKTYNANVRAGKLASGATYNMGFESTLVAESLFRWQEKVTRIKTLLLPYYTSLSDTQVFEEQPSGDWRVADHEGLVVTINTGRMIKLVDRLGFSRKNFLTSRFRNG